MADEEYLSRLDKYIDEKIGDLSRWNKPQNKNAFLATLELRMFAMQYSDVTIDYGCLYDAIQKYRVFGDTKNCDPEYSNFLFNSILNFQTAMFQIPEERNDVGKGQYRTLLSGSAKRPGNVYKTCGGQYLLYSLAADIHGIILQKKGLAAGMNFRRLITDRSMEPEEMFIELIETVYETEENLIKDYN